MADDFVVVVGGVVFCGKCRMKDDLIVMGGWVWMVSELRWIVVVSGVGLVVVAMLVGD